jgi:hypothetical protein
MASIGSKRKPLLTLEQAKELVRCLIDTQNDEVFEEVLNDIIDMSKSEEKRCDAVTKFIKETYDKVYTEFGLDVTKDGEYEKINNLLKSFESDASFLALSKELRQVTAKTNALLEGESEDEDEEEDEDDEEVDDEKSN